MSRVRNMPDDHQHPDYGAEVLGEKEREMIVTALKIELIPEIVGATKHYLSNQPAPKAPRWLLVATAVIGSVIFIGTMLTATLWGVSSLNISAANQQQLYMIYTEQTKELYRFHFEETQKMLADMETQNAVTRAYVIDVRTALASQGIRDPLHEP